MLIFKRIEGAVQSIKDSIAQNNGDTMALDLKKLDLLSKIIDYVKSYEWLKHERSRDKMRCFLESRYQYQKVVTEFGVSLNSVQVSVSYASKRLEEKIGKRTLDLIIAGDIDTAYREFLIGTGKYDPSQVFIDAIKEIFPEPKRNSAVNLVDCERELRYLKLFSKRTIKEMADSLDTYKVGHLLYILEKNDPYYTAERGVLLSLVNGEVSLKEALSQINSDFIYAAPQNNKTTEDE